MAKTLLISRIAAVDLHDYWDAVDIHDDDSDFVVDNDYIEAVREAWLALDRGLAGKKALFMVEMSDGAAVEVFDEARNRLDIAQGCVKSLHPMLEARQYTNARAMVRALQRLLRQR